MASKHKKDLTFNCDFCDEVFTKFNERRRHLVKVHKKDLIQCQFCGERVKTEEALETHMNFAHSEMMKARSEVNLDQSASAINRSEAVNTGGRISSEVDTVIIQISEQFELKNCM